MTFRLPLDGTQAVAEFDFDGTTARILSDFPGYAFTADGRCVSFKRKTPLVLKPGTSAGGYYCYVNIGKPPFKISQLLHQLVNRAFTPNPLNKPQVNHKDGNTRNNAASNLEWVTPSENIQHANKLRKQQGRTRIKTTAEQRTQAIALHSSGLGINEVAKVLEMRYDAARYIINSAKRASFTDS